MNRSRISEMTGVASAAGMGVPPPAETAASMTSQQIARHPEPGVYRGKKRGPRLKKDPMTRRALKPFREWLEEDKHDVRGVTGKMVDVKKAPVRHPGGKVTMEYPGKSSSSGGGD